MDMLYAVCFKYLKEPEAAKDAVMAVFEELIPKLRKHEVENIKSWLYTLTKNHCLMALRSARHLKTNELDPDRMQLEEELHLNGMMEKETHLEQLHECIQSLSAEQKIMVELFYLKNKCYNEIAVITGLDWNKVRSHIQNGRRNLKICMERKRSGSAYE